MKTIWFCGEDEKSLINVAESLGEELINREQCVELIVHSEIEEILGRGLKDTKEDKATFTDRLGFVGDLLHRNNIFALIVSNKSDMSDRKTVKETYGDYLQINIGNIKDSLCDLDLSAKEDIKANAKKIIEYLILEKILPEKSGSTEVYSKEEEEEIRRRLEELGYV